MALFCALTHPLWASTDPHYSIFDPDPAFDFYADPDPAFHSDVHSIQLSKMMQIYADPGPQHRAIWIRVLKVKTINLSQIYRKFSFPEPPYACPPPPLKNGTTQKIVFNHTHLSVQEGVGGHQH